MLSLLITSCGTTRGEPSDILAANTPVLPGARVQELVVTPDAPGRDSRQAVSAT